MITEPPEREELLLRPRVEDALCGQWWRRRPPTTAGCGGCWYGWWPLCRAPMDFNTSAEKSPTSGISPWDKCPIECLWFLLLPPCCDSSSPEEEELRVVSPLLEGDFLFCDDLTDLSVDVEW
jgi:hypothetical protein